MTNDEIKNAIRTFFERTSDVTPSDDENLFESGLLDSYGVVEFLTFIQEQFEVELDLEEITEANFSTIISVTRMIEASKEA